MLLVASALTPVRINGAAADWMATSAPGPLRRLVEMTAPVTGTLLVSLMLPASPARPSSRFAVAVLSGGTSRDAAPVGSYGPCNPRTCTATLARVALGLVTTSRRLPSPSGTPGITATGLGDVEGICQSTPAGFSSFDCIRFATAVTRP